MKVQTLILFPILSASASNANASPSSTSNNNLGLDAATLRALGLADDSLSVDDTANADANVDDDVLAPYDRDIEASEADMDDDDTDDEDAWWRDPLAQFEDEGDDDGANAAAGGVVIDTTILKPMMQDAVEEDDHNVQRPYDDDEAEGGVQHSDGLSEDAQRRLAERSIVPADDADADADDEMMIPSSTTTTGGGKLVERSKKLSGKDVSATIAAPLTFLLPASFPKLRSLITSVVGATPMNVLLSVVTAQYMMMYLAGSRRKSAKAVDDDETSADLESPVETVSGGGGGYTDSMYNLNEEANGADDTGQNVSKRGRLGVVQGAQSLFSHLGGGKQQTIDELSAELQAWRDSAEKKDMHNSMLSRENEDIVNQLGEIKRQLHGLQETNRYLKSQIRDNQNEIVVVQSRERQKANEEIARMRDAMMQVLAKERSLMKAQIKKTSEQVRALLAEDEDL
mmetsp:Transcript_16139/g.25164  ORF Transcript_16139/g.25164 Transcript_16139/m.25164 type:complete len:456 (-) Transcript_16139:1363-2730(-)